jgi:hypothetical protein
MKAVALRIGSWFLVATALVLIFWHFGWRFPRNQVVELLGGKLALLGLVGAVSTFQWGVWDTTVRRIWSEIHEAGWTLAEARLTTAEATAAAGGETRENIAALREAVSRRQWSQEQIDWIRNVFIPYSRAVLTNYWSAAVFLLLSSIVDLVALLVKSCGALEGAISAGTLMATVPPLVEIMIRYGLSLGQELGNWERGYRDSERPSEPSEGRK